MKKTIITLMLLAAVVISARAEWTNIVEQGKTWTYFAELDSPWPSQPRYLYLRIDGTEVIDGLEYAAVVASTFPPNEEEPDCILPVAYLRETADHDVYMRGGTRGCGEIWEFLHWLCDPEEVLLYSMEHPELTPYWASYCVPAQPYTTPGGKELKAYYDGKSTRYGMVVEGLGFITSGVDMYPDGFLLGEIGYVTGTSTIIHLESIISRDGTKLFWDQEVKDYADSKLGAVEAVRAAAENSSERYYNISGQPVANPEHGVFIKVAPDANGHNATSVIMR